MAEIVEWYNSLPFFTRHWFGASVLFPIAGKLGLLNPINLILTPQFLRNFHLWRPITSTFYYPTGFHYLMNLFFLYNYSLRLETGPQFMGRPGDYFFLLVFCWVSSVAVGYALGIPLLMDAMVLSVLYVWCQFNKEVIVNFWFGIRMKAMYLPFVFLVFNMLMGGSGIFEVIGILVGHLYYFVMIKYPEDNNYRLIDTPQIFHEWFPPTTTRSGAATFIPPNQGSTGSSNERRHNWGRGFTLGGL